MIRLKLYRDEARVVSAEFMPLLLEVCRMKIEHPESEEMKISSIIIFCLLGDIKKKIDKKLLTDHIKLTTKLSDAEAVCLYKLLMSLPVDQDKVYKWMLRQKITDFLHQNLNL